MFNGLLVLLGTVALLAVAFMLLDRFVKGWRTVVLNAIQAVPLIGGAIADQAEALNLGSYVSERYMLWYIGGVLVANVLFRFGTDTPVGARDVFDRR